MPPSPIEGYRLTPRAGLDLEDIWVYSARTWSPGQADTYLRGLHAALADLCANPMIARERQDTVPPVRLHPYRSHLIIFMIEEDHLNVLRVAHRRQNWHALLERPD